MDRIFEDLLIAIAAGVTGGIVARVDVGDVINEVMRRGVASKPYLYIRSDGKTAKLYKDGRIIEVSPATSADDILVRAMDEIDDAGVIVIDGVVTIRGKVTLPPKRIMFVGVDWNHADYRRSRSAIVFRDRVVDSGKFGGFYLFSNIELAFRGSHDKPAMYLPKSVAHFYNTKLALEASLADNVRAIEIGSAGPPGFPAVFRNVKFYDNRRSGNYSFFMSLWQEGIVIDGGVYIVNVTEDVGWFRFLKINGNTMALLSNIDMFIAGMGSNKFESVIITNIPMSIVNVQFPREDIVANYHITSDIDNVPVYVDAARYNEAGEIMVPIASSKVKMLLGSTYRREGWARVQGTGEAELKIATHDLPVTSETPYLVVCSPLSGDAYNSAPVTCRLGDDNDDGIYESIYARFAVPPGPGTDIAVAYHIAMLPKYKS